MNVEPRIRAAGRKVDDPEHPNRQATETSSPYNELRQQVQGLEEESRRLERRNNAVKKVNEKYCPAAKSQTDFICRFLLDGTITFVNDALARRIGKPPEQLINQNFYQYLPADDRDWFRGNLAALSLENSVIELDERIANAKDEVFWLHWINTAHCGQTGRVEEIEGVGRDVTELRRVQRSLEKSRHRFHFFVNTMDEGFIEANEQFITTYVNEKICKMLGYEREELIGRPAISFFDKKNQEIIGKQLEKRKKGERGSYEITWKKKNGEDLQTLMSPAAWLDKNGAFRGCYTVVTDITKVKQTERALKEREKALKRKTAELAEANAALKTLLKVRDESIEELEEAIASNVRRMVMPYLRKLERRLGKREKGFIRNIESNLNRLISPMAKNLALNSPDLTPAELQVAALVKDGNSSKEIAQLLSVSQRTVDYHRRNIRKKLGLANTRANLRTHLMSFE